MAYMTGKIALVKNGIKICEKEMNTCTEGTTILLARMLGNFDVGKTEYKVDSVKSGNTYIPFNVFFDFDLNDEGYKKDIVDKNWNTSVPSYVSELSCPDYGRITSPNASRIVVEKDFSYNGTSERIIKRVFLTLFTSSDSSLNDCNYRVIACDEVETAIVTNDFLTVRYELDFVGFSHNLFSLLKWCFERRPNRTPPNFSLKNDSGSSISFGTTGNAIKIPEVYQNDSLRPNYLLVGSGETSTYWKVETPISSSVLGGGETSFMLENNTIEDRLIIKRSFTNNSASTVVVTEVGVYGAPNIRLSSGNVNTTTYCIQRCKLVTPITVASGAGFEVSVIVIINANHV